jgi:hypothetical protein
MVKYSDMPMLKIVLGHADAEIIEIIIFRSNKEFLFWTHAEGLLKPRYYDFYDFKLWS